MGLMDRLLGRKPAERSFNPFLPGDFPEWGRVGSLMFPFGGLHTTYTGKQEDIAGDFSGLVNGAYRRNGVTEYLVWLTMAKLPETRARRLAETLAALTVGRKWAQRKLVPR